MNALAETIPEAVGDWQLRGIRARGYDLMFAPDELSDSALSAASRAQDRFRLPFPAWEAYRAIINGGASYFPPLVEYATGVGLAMMLAIRPDGRQLTRKPGPWMVQAAQDAMARAVVGSYPAPSSQRADEYDVPRRTYSRIRDAIAREFIAAIEDFQAAVHRQAEIVLRIDRQLP
jgi:hypothetical protein